MGAYDRMKWKDQCDQEMNDYSTHRLKHYKTVYFLKLHYSFELNESSLVISVQVY